jgi:hypothetical protein
VIDGLDGALALGKDVIEEILDFGGGHHGHWTLPGRLFGERA